MVVFAVIEDHFFAIMVARRNGRVRKIERRERERERREERRERERDRERRERERE